MGSSRSKEELRISAIKCSDYETKETDMQESYLRLGDPISFSCTNAENIKKKVEEIRFRANQQI